jgi:hypothetical protein
MDLSRAVYSRDLKIAAMRALDAGVADNLTFLVPRPRPGTKSRDGEVVVACKSKMVYPPNLIVEAASLLGAGLRWASKSETELGRHFVSGSLPQFHF